VKIASAAAKCAAAASGKRILESASPASLATLDRVATAPLAADQPLSDPNVLRLLNQPSQNGAIGRGGALDRGLRRRSIAFRQQRDAARILGLDIEAQRGDYRDAYDSFTSAVDMLRRGAIANAGTGNEPSCPATCRANRSARRPPRRTPGARRDAARPCGRRPMTVSSARCRPMASPPSRVS
jgi:hypothetical protein